MCPFQPRPPHEVQKPLASRKVPSRVSDVVRAPSHSHSPSWSSPGFGVRYDPIGHAREGRTDTLRRQTELLTRLDSPSSHPSMPSLSLPAYEVGNALSHGKAQTRSRRPQTPALRGPPSIPPSILPSFQPLTYLATLNPNLFLGFCLSSRSLRHATREVEVAVGQPFIVRCDSQRKRQKGRLRHCTPNAHGAQRGR